MLVLKITEEKNSVKMNNEVEGHANLAFEDTTDNNDSKRPNEETKHAFEPEIIRENEEMNLCYFWGIIPLPECFQRIFLKPAWMLVFLCWAAIVQVWIKSRIKVSILQSVI